MAKFGKEGFEVEICNGLFPTLWKSYEEKWAPEDCVLAGSDLMKNTSLETVSKFVKTVFTWAGGAIHIHKEKILNDSTLQLKFSSAIDNLNENEPNQALKHLTDLKYVKTSIASKFLRFMNPSDCVVLDSVIRDELGFNDTEYETWRLQCINYKEELKMSAGEIESSVFFFLGLPDALRAYLNDSAR